ncbi:MAG: hypothetical protein L0Y80_08925 [Ignavibacteriae bacterium]|nr:hypothetical protein [Ignavibacteriota bacterium]
MPIFRQTHIVAIALAIMLSSFGFLCSDAGVNSVETKPGEKVEVLLKEGNSITLEPDNFVLEFSSVEQDSRCPDDVVCVWQGEAEIMLTLLIQRGRMRRNVTIPGLVQTPYRGEAIEMLRIV